MDMRTGGLVEAPQESASHDARFASVRMSDQRNASFGFRVCSNTFFVSALHC